MTKEQLLESIDALLKLDAANALVPHGIGGHARTLLTEAATALSQAEGAQKRWRHRKRGSSYTEVARGRLQCSTFTPDEGCEMVVYRGDDGKTWVRTRAEFEDGRFEALPTRPREQEGAEPAEWTSGTERTDLKVGSFYWVWIVFDPDATSLAKTPYEERNHASGDLGWENDFMPARYAGLNDKGERLWNYMGMDDESDWPVRWIGDEIIRDMPHPLPAASFQAGAEAIQAGINALEAAEEELRLIRMKDCRVIYDTLLRNLTIPLALQKLRALLPIPAK